MVNTDGRPTIASKQSDKLLALAFDQEKAERNLRAAQADDIPDALEHDEYWNPLEELGASIRVAESDLELPVYSLKQGDTRVQDGRTIWTALQDAVEHEDGTISVRVMYADGDTVTRQWQEDRRNWLLPIRRVTLG